MYCVSLHANKIDSCLAIHNYMQSTINMHPGALNYPTTYLGTEVQVYLISAHLASTCISAPSDAQATKHNTLVAMLTFIP